MGPWSAIVPAVSSSRYMSKGRSQPSRSAEWRSRHGFRYGVRAGGREGMLHMALVFLVIGLIAALLGFTSIAGASIAIAKFLAGLFLVLFLVFLVIGMVATRKIVG